MRPGSLVAAALVSCWGGVAAATESPLTLRWDAPAECPSLEHVRADVDRRLGGSIDAKPVDARAVVSRRGDTWQVVLATQQAGTSGERTLEGPTCAAVAAATALVLALTIDPQALSRPKPPPAPPPAPPPTPPPPRPLTPTSRPPPVPGLWLRSSYVAGLGIAANVAPLGLGLGFGVTARRLSVELVANSLWEADEAAPGVGGSFWMLAVGGSACGAVIATRAVRTGGCGGFEIQRLQGEGYGVALPRTRAAAWGAPTVSWFFETKIASALWFTARLDAAFPLSQPRFVLAGVGPVFRVSPVSGRASVGVEVRF